METDQRFDFDDWSRLASSAPEQFEAARARLIQATLEAGSDPLRLRRLQWKIDMVRARTPNALVSCRRVSGMMWQAFHRVNEELGTAFQQILDNECCAASAVKPGARAARILEFRPRPKLPVV